MIRENKVNNEIRMGGIVPAVRAHARIPAGARREGRSARARHQRRWPG